MKTDEPLKKETKGAAKKLAPKRKQENQTLKRQKKK